MKELEKIVASAPIKITLSKGIGEYRKGTVRVVEIKGKREYQLELFTQTQAFHKNFDQGALYGELELLFGPCFKQINAVCADCELSLGLSKKGRVLFNSKKVQGTTLKNADHNRAKSYILPEGTPVPALVDLGVMTADGRVAKAKYDKFKQINRFVELVDDVLKNDKSENLSVIDFGCGKSYLTFVLYHYLTQIRGTNSTVIGLDLKEKVIEDCNAIAQKYGYNGLTFKAGDIADFPNDAPCDMMISLHACDTATDLALYNAIKHGARYIMSVPCCQHEVNRSMKDCRIPLICDHGILKERFSAIATDALRAALLTYCGYDVQVLEFIDMAHSPKNLLIRAVKKDLSAQTREKALAKAKKLIETLGTEQTLYKLVTEK